MSFRRIEYFLSVAKHLNFTKAARECYVAQAAISQQIKQFEEELGFKLFNRGGASVSLTPAGEYFAKQCQAVLAQYNGAVKQARFLAEGKKRDLRLGINGPYTQECIPDYLRRLSLIHIWAGEKFFGTKQRPPARQTAAPGAQNREEPEKSIRLGRPR